MADRVIRNTSGSAYLRFVSELSAAWGIGKGRIVHDPEFAISRDPAIWEKIRKDPVIDHAIARRLHLVGGRERIVEAGEDGDQPELLADVWRDARKAVKFRHEAQLQLAKAVLLGRTFGFVEGGRRRCILGGIESDWWIPRRIVPIDRRRVVFAIGEDENGKRCRVTKIWHIERREWIECRLDRMVALLYDDEEGRLGYGRGILESVYFYHWAKGNVLREGLQGIERMHQGLKIAKVGDNRGDENATKEAIRTAFMNELDKHMARHTLVIDEADDVQVLFPPGNESNTIVPVLRYLDEGVTQRIVGSVLPSGGGGETGSLARAQVEDDATEDLVSHDRKMLDEALTEGLVGTFIRKNRPQLEDAGLWGVPTPRERTKPVEVENPTEFATMLASLSSLKRPIRVRRDEVYKGLGLSVPSDDDDDVVEIGGAEAGGVPGLSLGGLVGAEA